MWTVLPVSVIDAPCPLSITIPVSLTVMRAPEDVRRVTPPVGPGASEMVTACLPGVTSVIWLTPAWGAGTGSSPAEPHQPPLQIGKSGSPCSNSIQTPAPTGGSATNPAAGPA